MFEGIVQGVVVQMIAYKSLLLSNPADLNAFFLSSSSNLNLTYIEVDVWSAYSTSASASAVSQDAHQYTGLSPFSMYPFCTFRRKL